SFLEWNNRIIRYRDVFGANLRTTLRNITVADSLCGFQIQRPVLSIQGVHFESRGVNKKPGADKFLHMVVSQNVADILAQEALDALSEFLDAIDIGLRHPPASIGRVWWARLEFLDALLGCVVEGHIRHEVLDLGKCLHGLNRDGLIEWQIA